jgi:CMP-2-keto-3-deoxyoctulosonic acid synthetase
METTLIKNLKLEVIATYEDGEQEIFQTKLTKEILKDETSLLNFVRSILDYATDSDLCKLSFCFMCKENLVKKYKTIQESIYNKNGKYFFQNNQLIK